MALPQKFTANDFGARWLPALVAFAALIALAGLVSIDAGLAAAPARDAAAAAQR